MDSFNEYYIFMMTHLRVKFELAVFTWVGRIVVHMIQVVVMNSLRDHVI